jgi:hypothetical protein
MPTESEIKVARYQKVEKEPDGLGRVIGVRRLKPSEQTRVAGYCAEAHVEAGEKFRQRQTTLPAWPGSCGSKMRTSVPSNTAVL